MGDLVAKLLNRHPWISYAGVFIVLYVALAMIYRGGMMMASSHNFIKPEQYGRRVVAFLEA